MLSSHAGLGGMLEVPVSEDLGADPIALMREAQDRLRKAVDAAGEAIEEGEQLATSFRDMDAKMEKLLTSEKFAPLFANDFGPYVYPAAIAGVLLLAFTTLLIARDRRYVEIVKIVGAVALWILLAPELGFILVSGAIVFLLLVSFGNRIWVSAALTSVLVPLVYLVFVHGLGVGLPRGYLDW